MNEYPSEIAGQSNEVAPDTMVACLEGIGLRYGKVRALIDINLDIPAGCLAGFIGPDGVGKSSLLALIAGTRKIQSGRVKVFGINMANASNRLRILPRIAFMPQGLGKNLYSSLTVFENLDFFARLFGHDRSERRRRIKELTQATGLAPFVARPAGKLSGGMKQKLGLCCALIHDPELLILDEPTTGVDPLSRRQFWELIGRIRAVNSTMSVLVATAYMEEAERFDTLVAMDAGRILATGKPKELLRRTGTESLEAAFISLLPEEKQRMHNWEAFPPFEAKTGIETAIEAKDLTMRFGDFTAVDHVSFHVRRGEIFGFLGSNGCGKTTTMKMLTGLLPPTQGLVWMFGKEIDPHDLDTRRRVGYMSQSFSLYSELSVVQNLRLHARLFEVPPEEIDQRTQEIAARFDLLKVMDKLPDTLPLGVRQRLSLAVAMIHKPEMLILDEPTSGVDPVMRDAFWESLGELSRRDEVTIFISTHFMNEAERCDRISLMHAGQVLAVGNPAELAGRHGTDSLEDAFVAYLEAAVGESDVVGEGRIPVRGKKPIKHEEESSYSGNGFADYTRFFDPRRMVSYARRETLELIRDPIRLTLALLGSAILMLVMGYGITLDVEDLSVAVLDRDQTTLSRDYTLNIAGSRYFIEKKPINDYKEMDRLMRSGKLALAIEIPPGFGSDLSRGRPVSVGVWIDGAMPTRGETIRAYVRGMHNQWLSRKAREAGNGGALAGLVNIETRFRYNPDVKSVVAMVPAVIPLLLMMIPAMLAALAVVREKELGSITNFYVTPTTSLEFLLGKQAPYVVLSVLSFLLLTLMAVALFRVPFTGSFAVLSVGALLYVSAATALGLLLSSFMRSQIAALFATAVLTLLPAIEYSGMLNPVSSLEGPAKVIGQVYPTTHFLTITRGVFSKALGFADLTEAFVPLLLSVPVLVGLSSLLLKKQER